jgi:histone-arginine methyltransferase CARM1
VLQTRIEDIHDPALEKAVDVIVSEPLGTMLFNERMLETYIIARDKFLKPGGKMYPSQAFLCVAPFYDEALYNEQMNKTTFWGNSNFYGFDLSTLRPQAVLEKFRQPLIEVYDPKTQYPASSHHALVSPLKIASKSTSPPAPSPTSRHFFCFSALSTSASTSPSKS